MREDEYTLLAVVSPYCRGVSILHSHRFKILALDIDGTILDREGNLRDRTIHAVNRAAEAGIRPILCTGRRYRRALSIAEKLGIHGPLVCNSGAILKDSTEHRTLWRADFEEGLLGEILNIFHHRNEPVLSFTDRSNESLDFLVSHAHSGRRLFDDYLDQNRPYAEINSGWVENPGPGHFHLCAIGTRSTMKEFDDLIHENLPGRVQTFVQKSPRYSGTMCEVLRHDANKWSALLQLARHWNVNPSEVCAVGDDMNDIPMIRGAGLGVAMGHACAAVKEVADLVTGEDDEDGVAMLIEDFLLGE
ncbi:HAD family hydrolase [Tundrisphaera lichenicola]|uniref:HAD family hydrolase n=1 Tax=Tundrisphaera lichenicola TaxID=2029860 RepID=UPI003EB8AB67